MVGRYDYKRLIDADGGYSDLKMDQFVVIDDLLAHSHQDKINKRADSVLLTANKAFGKEREAEIWPDKNAL